MSETFSFNPITGQLDLVSTTAPAGDTYFVDLENDDGLLLEDDASFMLLESAT